VSVEIYQDERLLQYIAALVWISSPGPRATLETLQSTKLLLAEPSYGELETLENSMYHNNMTCAAHLRGDRSVYTLI